MKEKKCSRIQTLEGMKKKGKNSQMKKKSPNDIREIRH